MYRCPRCGQLWHDSPAEDNGLSCTKRCGSRLEAVPPLGLADLRGLDLQRLPYSVALTAWRLDEALQSSTDVLKTLFLLKDCAEAAIKFVGSILLVEYLRSPACTTQRNAVLLEKLIRPALGMWVNDVVRPVSLWLIAGDQEPGRSVAALFAEPAKKKRGNPSETELFRRCNRFVAYRNDALGHGARQRDEKYEVDLRDWLPVVRGLLDGIASLARWRLMLVADVDRCQVWMGRQPSTATEPGSFPRTQVGHFVLRGAESQVRDLFPFLCYLPVRDNVERLHYYDSLHRYKAAGKDALALEYDEGFKHARPEPVAGLEQAFTAELLAEKFGRHRGKMEVIEGRVASFGALIDEHTAIVGRRFVINRVARLLRDDDRGLLVIEAEPGKGKTALLAHLVDETYGHVAPPPVHFFYRRTAGITDPDVCAKSLYHALLEAHNLTEAEESRQQADPDSMFLKLTNLLKDQVASRLTPGRPQLIFIDALDESEATANGRTAFQRIPENLPTGVYVIATTRPVTDRVGLARRPFLHWFDLDDPDYLQDNLNDGLEYARRELASSPLSDGAIVEVARVAAGNFLVLTLLSKHIRTDVAHGDIPAFLHRLATDGARDKLGFIYEEFWHRITARLARVDLRVLCDVAGVLVAAFAPLTAEVITGVLGLRAGDWDFALRHLHEYLTVLRSEEGEEVEIFYRIYHESFADFLRTTVSIDQTALQHHLADYCRRWAMFPEGYARTYALRFALSHLVEAHRVPEANCVLMDFEFLRAKVEAGFVHDLLADFDLVTAHPQNDDGTRQRQLSASGFEQRDANRRFLLKSAHHINRDPEQFFALALAGPRDTPLSAAARAVWDSGYRPRRPLLRMLHPPARDTQPHEVCTIHVGSPVWTVVALEIGGRLHALSGSNDGVVRLWDVERAQCVRELAGHTGAVTHILVGPDSNRIVTGSSRGELRIWDLRSGRCDRQLVGHTQWIEAMALSADARRLVSCARTTRCESGTFNPAGASMCAKCLITGPQTSVSLLGECARSWRAPITPYGSGTWIAADAAR